jgi:carbon-monoxide dehydrogenase medium subunit/xanthine dehydrogenase FAD-binding subunit
MLTCDEYLTPTSLADAFAAMAQHRGRYRVVAGATDTLPWAREGRAGDVNIPLLIDVSKIPELNELRVDERRVRLGAATPIQRFLDDAALARALPALPRCAVWFADDQIRQPTSRRASLHTRRASNSFPPPANARCRCTTSSPGPARRSLPRANC